MRYWTLLDPTTDNTGGLVPAGTLVARPDDWVPPKRTLASGAAGTNTPTDEIRAIECDETGKPLKSDEEKAAEAKEQASATAETAAKAEKEAAPAAAVQAQLSGLNPATG